MSEFFGKTWEFFGKLSEIFFRTWEIFSHKWESPKNRPQRNGFAKPLARVTRARITGIFIFSLSQPSHERWFLPRNRLKMFPKRKRLHKKTHPLFCREMVKVVKAKNQISRGRRAWRAHARNWHPFFTRWARKEGNVKKSLFRKLLPSRCAQLEVVKRSGSPLVQWVDISSWSMATS